MSQGPGEGDISLQTSCCEMMPGEARAGWSPHTSPFISIYWKLIVLVKAPSKTGISGILALPQGSAALETCKGFSESWSLRCNMDFLLECSQSPPPQDGWGGGGEAGRRLSLSW